MLPPHQPPTITHIDYIVFSGLGAYHIAGRDDLTGKWGRRCYRWPPGAVVLTGEEDDEGLCCGKSGNQWCNSG